MTKNIEKQETKETSEKTLDELIYETKENIISAINESGLPVSVTGMILREFAADLSELERTTKR